MANTTKSFKAKRRIMLLALVMPIVVLTALVWHWSNEGNTYNEQLRQRAENVAKSIKVLPQLQPQNTEWQAAPWWIGNAPAPHLTFTYKVVGSNKEAYEALKQSMIEVCGAPTPEFPGKVSGDDESYASLGSGSCRDDVGIDYDVDDSGTARFMFTPL